MFSYLHDIIGSFEHHAIDLIAHWLVAVVVIVVIVGIVVSGIVVVIIIVVVIVVIGAGGDCGRVDWLYARTSASAEQLNSRTWTVHPLPHRT